MALSERELAYIISAKDEASQMFARINAAAEKSGMSIKDVMNQTSAAMDKAGSSTNKLTNFIREQRQENRMQNFLFREGAGAVATFATGLTMLSSTAGAASESTKQLSHALNAGFAAFQSFDFLLAGLGVTGGIGLAIAGVAALAAAFMSMSSAAEESTKKMDDLTLKIKEQEYALKMLSASAMMQAYTQALADAYKEQERLNQKTIDWWATVKDATRSLLTGGRYQSSVIRKVLGTPEELAQAQVAINDVFLKIQAFQEKAEKEKREPVLGSPDKIAVAWKAAFEVIHGEFEKVTAKWNAGLRVIGSRVREVRFEFNEAALNIGMQWSTLFSVMGSGIDAVSSQIVADWNMAFEKAFGFAHTLLGKFVGAVIAAIAQIASKLLASAAVAGILSLVTGGGFGAFFNVLSGGLSGLMGVSAPRPSVTPVAGVESVNRGGPSIVNINFMSPVPHGEWIKQSVEEGMKRTGLAVDKYFLNRNQDLALSF